MNKPTISPGLARLRANGNGEAMRLRTLAEQERAINEVRALRTAGKPEDRWIPGNNKDYPNGKGPTVPRRR
jgi:hypothetical protein